MSSQPVFVTWLTPRHVLVLIAAVLMFIVALAWAVPFDLPRPEAWFAFAFVAFFLAFL